jgi:hypothetical protein
MASPIILVGSIESRAHRAVFRERVREARSHVEQKQRIRGTRGSVEAAAGERPHLRRELTMATPLCLQNRPR